MFRFNKWMRQIMFDVGGISTTRVDPDQRPRR